MTGRPRMLISACLLGVDCRYDGGGQALGMLEELLERFELIPVCPEQLGGLPTPRTPSERRGDRVVSRDALDVTDAFLRGARQACRLARIYGVKLALMKARSPSCGSGKIYDGSFSGRTIPGDGVAAEALKAMGVTVCSEEDLSTLLDHDEVTATNDTL